MRIVLICREETAIEEAGKKIVFKEGQMYTAECQSIDRKKWFIYDEAKDRFVYIDKYKFDVVVHYYIKLGYYDDFRLPLIGMEGQMYIFLTPTGYTQHAHKLDVITESGYKSPQYIPSNEICFR